MFGEFAVFDVDCIDRASEAWQHCPKDIVAAKSARWSGKLGLVSCVIAWSAALAMGVWSLADYASVPGAIAETPEAWPAGSTIAHDGRFTLVFFAHPTCPCTRASLAELDRIAAFCHQQVDTHVLFIAPLDAPQNWSSSDLYVSARRIPGAAVHRDIDRRESQLFGALTSGTCMLYDPDKRLVFRGGLTSARGHEGENDGADSIRSILTAHTPSKQETFVFGCPLFEPASRCAPSRCSTEREPDDR